MGTKSEWYKLFICKQCGEVHYLGMLYGNNVCPYCNGELLSIEHFDDYWYEEYRVSHSLSKKDRITGYMLHDWLREIILNNEYDHEIREKVLADQEAEHARISAKMAAAPQRPHCPRCQSSNVTKEKRGFSTGRAVAAGMLTGFLDVAAVAGAAGRNKLVNVCQDCGHTWK